MRVSGGRAVSSLPSLHNSHNSNRTGRRTNKITLCPKTFFSLIIRKSTKPARHAAICSVLAKRAPFHQQCVSVEKETTLTFQSEHRKIGQRVFGPRSFLCCTFFFRSPVALQQCLNGLNSGPKDSTDNCQRNICPTQTSKDFLPGGCGKVLKRQLLT